MNTCKRERERERERESLEKTHCYSLQTFELKTKSMAEGGGLFKWIKIFNKCDRYCE